MLGGCGGSSSSTREIGLSPEVFLERKHIGAVWRIQKVTPWKVDTVNNNFQDSKATEHCFVWSKNNWAGGGIEGIIGITFCGPFGTETSWNLKKSLATSLLHVHILVLQRDDFVIGIFYVPVCLSLSSFTRKRMTDLHEMWCIVLSRTNWVTDQVMKDDANHERLVAWNRPFANVRFHNPCLINNPHRQRFLTPFFCFSTAEPATDSKPH